MSNNRSDKQPRELLKSAAAAVREMRSRLHAEEQKSREPIAVIGLGCRFPGGADSPEKYWCLLETGIDAVTDIPPDRFAVDDFYDRDPDAPGKIATRRGAFLADIDKFDADFFGISAREARQMDPQQRLLLEVAWEALEDAGQTLDGLARSLSSVFVGAIAPDYMWRQLDDPGRIDAYSGTGTHTSLLSGRLSYLLDLRGPSLTIDTACSSSLVAVHLACQSLRQRESDLAFAGGVNLVTSPVSLMAFSRMGLLASDGICKSFDSRADGFVGGEGCGIVILKRLEAALADGDNIRAVIRGSAVNQDGRSSALTAPNGPAQVDVIRRSLANAGVPAERVSYVEAHGTGTALGDPIEVEALKSVLDVAEGGEARCAIGSVKTNIGHLGAAAGIAGLIKVVLSLEHRRIPANLHLRQLNPHISLEGSRLFVPVDPVDWPDGREPLCAGVSSFGWSGTNAHATLEQAPATSGIAAAPSPVSQTHVLPLSARSPEALTALASAYARALSRGDFDGSLPGLIYTVATRRSHHKYRLAVTGDTADLLARKLDQVAPGLPTEERRKHGAVFVFCGQGSQWQGMGQELYAGEKIFRVAMDEADAAVRSIAGWSILEKIASAESLENTQFAQPAIFAVQVALALLWRSWGVEPRAVVGHSVGEVAAAHTAGVLSFDDALKVVLSRGSRMQAATDLGGMAEVALTQAQAVSFLDEFPDVEIVACNSPSSVVLGGAPGPLQAAVDALESAGVRCTMLRVRYAFHSAQMDPYVAPLVNDLRGLQPAVASLPIFSTVRGAPARDGDFDADYWGRNIRQPVLFADAIGKMIDDGHRLFLEIGPHPVLSAAILGGLEARKAGGEAVSSLRRTHPERRAMLESLATLYGTGLNVRFDRVVQADAHVRPLPPYPWQRKRYWLDLAPPLPSRAERDAELPSYAIEWEPVGESSPNDEVRASDWLLIEDGPRTLGNALAACLEQAGASCRRGDFGGERARYDAMLKASRAPGGPFNVVFIAPERSTPESAGQLCAELCLLAQSCLEARRDLKLWVVTRGAQLPNADCEVSGVAQAPLIGFARSLAVEAPHIWGGSIDLAPEATVDCKSVLTRIAVPGTEKEFAVGADGTLVPRLSTCVAAPGQAAMTVRGDRAYLITGGLGSVGLAIARMLVEAGARHLMLFARGEPSADTAHAIRDMERRGAACTLYRGDVAVKRDVDEAIARFGASLPKLAGVVHAAGTLSDATVSSIAPDQMQGVLSAKVAGAWHLHEAVGDRPLDFFVMMSSLSSVLGSAGQASYSAANAFLDRLAHHRQALGQRALAINWGPWEGTHMTEQVPEGARRRWVEQGISPFTAVQGTALFMRLAAGSAAQRCAVLMDWDRFRRARPETIAITGRLGVAPLAEDDTAQARSALAQFRRAANSGVWMLSWMKRKAAEILVVGEDDISDDRNLLEFGFDSLMVMQLLRATGQAFDLRVYPREFYDRPTARRFASYIAEELALGGGRSSSPIVLPAEPAAAEARSSPPTGKLDAPVVFLLSAPRSGSTLLRVMLAGHPGLFCPPELHLLGFATMGERRSGLQGSSLDEGLVRAIKALRDCSTAEARSIEAGWVSADLPIQAVYERLQDMGKGRVLVDKSPTYATNPEALRNAERLFASARYIHLLRHPLAVMESFVRNRFDRLLGLKGQAPSEAAERVWLESNRNISELFRSIDSTRITTIRYESLVRDPAEVMTGLCTFLRIPFDHSVLQPYQGERMTDGLESKSMSIGDPGFLEHAGIDASLADSWQDADGGGERLGPETRKLALDYHYDLPGSPAHEKGMREAYVDVRGLSLCLCSWGSPEGHPVFILHGLLDHGAAWDGVARALAARGFRVFAPDQRGHGRSQHVGPEGSYCLIDFLADADALTEQIGSGPVTLVGHSMGASVAAMLAAARPDRARRLILVEPVLAPDSNERNYSNMLSGHLDAVRCEAKAQTFADIAAAAERLREFNAPMNAAQAAKMAERLVEPCPGGVRWRWDERIRTHAGTAHDGRLTLDAPRFLSMLSEIDMPVSLIMGADSEFAAHGRNSKLRGARRGEREIVLPGGHNLHKDCCSILARSIAEAAASTVEVAET